MISILIPVYNYVVIDLVDALKTQTINNSFEYEIICLDDCSTDESTLKINRSILQDNQSKFFYNKANLGRTKSRTILAQKAKYDWLLFLDADVLPTSKEFLSNYFNSISRDFECICGGISYEESSKNINTQLRWKYGKEREEKSASFRMTNPYNYLLSGNMLIKKEVFLKYNFSENENLYGMDVFFGYQLFRNQVKLNHIDNPVLHLGLENNQKFFDKSLEAAKNRKDFLINEPKIEEVNSLLKHYKTLKKYRLISIVNFFFNVSKPVLKHFIFKKNPNLFCFDLYRLGYICSNKTKHESAFFHNNSTL